MKTVEVKRRRTSPARDAIRGAAIQLFSEKGFAATSTREICQRARVTKPVLYYHFGSKDQLYLELVVDACNEVRKQLILAAQRGASSREKIVDVLTADFADTIKNPGLTLVLLRAVFAPEKNSPAVDYLEIALEWIRLLETIVADGVRRGEMKGNPWEIAEAIMGVHFIYTMGYLLTGQPVLDRLLALRIVDLFFKGCGSNVTER